MTESYRKGDKVKVSKIVTVSHDQNGNVVNTNDGVYCTDVWTVELIEKAKHDPAKDPNGTFYTNNGRRYVKVADSTHDYILIGVDHTTVVTPYSPSIGDYTPEETEVKDKHPSLRDRDWDLWHWDASVCKYRCKNAILYPRTRQQVQDDFGPVEEIH